MNLSRLSLIGLIAIIVGILILLFPWLIGFLLGVFFVVYGVSRFFKKDNLKITMIVILALLGFFIYAYIGYPEDNMYEISDFNINNSDRILIIAPHPDDEALSSAGIISRAVNKDIPVATVVMTTGDGYRADVDITSATLYPKPQKFIEYGNRRHIEDINAMNKLGLNQSSIYFLGYPDEGMQYLFDTNWDQNNLYRGMNGADHVPYSFAYQHNTSYCGENVDKNLEGIINSFRPTVIIYPGPGDDHLITGQHITL